MFGLIANSMLDSRKNGSKLNLNYITDDELIEFLKQGGEFAFIGYDMIKRAFDNPELLELAKGKMPYLDFDVISVVIKGDFELFKKIIAHEDFEVCDTFMSAVVEHGTLDMIKLSLEKIQRPISFSHIMAQVIMENDIETLNLILSYEKDTTPDSWCYVLQEAFSVANMEAFQLVLAHSNFKFDLNRSYISTPCNSILNRQSDIDARKEMVKVILSQPLTEEGFHSNLYGAVQNDMSDILTLMLEDPRVDPAYKGSEILGVAIEYESVKCLDLLLGDGRVDALQKGRNKYNDSNSHIINTSHHENIGIFKKVFEYAKSKSSVDFPIHEVLMGSIQAENLDNLKYVLSDPDIDPSHNKNEAIKMTCYQYDGDEKEELIKAHPRYKENWRKPRKSKESKKSKLS